MAMRESLLPEALYVPWGVPEVYGLKEAVCLWSPGSDQSMLGEGNKKGWDLK